MSYIFTNIPIHTYGHRHRYTCTTPTAHTNTYAYVTCVYTTSSSPISNLLLHTSVSKAHPTLDHRMITYATQNVAFVCLTFSALLIKKNLIAKKH